ncbi:MAG: hypothetical protein DRJ01_18855, partial [Bacteroidetes bacterium]
MKSVIIIISLFTICLLWANEYQINLSWDEFEGECNGFISGTIGEDYGNVNGVSSETSLNNKLISVGEGKSADTQQSFIINSNEGFFTFWLKDKFADQDMNNDPTLIARAKPIITISRNHLLVEQIKIPKGNGLTCKVFTIDAATGEIDKEIRYFPKSRIILGKVVNAVDAKPIKNVKITLTDYLKERKFSTTDESGAFIFNADIGKYKINFSKDGFISTNVSVRMGADETPRELISAMSPEITKFRIVLTWGSRPRDLDAHLRGPNPEGGNFHIWYRHKILIAGKDFLDRDDTSSYGPETITIYKPAIGDYYYSIHDYSNRKQKRSSKLSF